MLIDFDEVLKTVDGLKMAIAQDSKEKATLQMVCREALLSNESSKGISGKEKFERWELAKKLKGPVDLKTDEVAKLKELLGVVYGPTVVGPAYELLEKSMLLKP